MQLTFCPRRLTRVLVFVVIGLTAASVAAQLLLPQTETGKASGVANFFSLDQENNLPTWYQSFSLLLCAGLLGVIAGLRRQESDPFARHWTALSCVFVYLSLDEMASIHERIFNPLLRFITAHSPFHWLFFGWTVFGTAFVALVLVAFIPFLRHLPAWASRAFLLAGSIYVGGAVALEKIGDLAGDRWGITSLPYVLLSTLEEVGEMAGILLFLRALLTFWGRLGETVQISVPLSPTVSRTAAETWPTGLPLIAPEVRESGVRLHS